MQKISTAFVKAQKEFGPALKTSTNPHFKSKYADLAACIEAVIDALNNNGIALVQQSHHCEDGVIVETLFVHESGEVISGGKFHVVALKKDPQGYGSAMTYARRYSLQAACGIAPEDDDGNRAVAPTPTVQKPTIQKPTKPVAEPLERELRTKKELLKIINEASSPEILAVFWRTLTADECDLVRDEVTVKGTELKAAKGVLKIGEPRDA
jgi:hypothetical protein